MGTGEGTFEIERRYLVRVREGLWGELGPGSALRQGYVATGRTSVRIRVGEARGPVLTCKSGSGVRRREDEAVVPEGVAAALLRASGSRVIEKVRYRVGPWELDRFQGALEGLALLEIELERVDEPVPQPPAGVEIVREITDDNNFTSSALARMTEGARRRLVERVREEIEGG